jgi:hypothetical protein
MLIHCKQLNFGSEFQMKFAADQTTSAANPKFSSKHTIRQRMLIRCKQLNFGNEFQIHCRQFNFGIQSQIRCTTHNSAANVNSLQTTQFQKFATNNLTSAVNPKFTANNAISAVNFQTIRPSLYCWCVPAKWLYSPSKSYLWNIAKILYSLSCSWPLSSPLS